MILSCCDQESSSKVAKNGFTIMIKNIGFKAQLCRLCYIFLLTIIYRVSFLFPSSFSNHVKFTTVQDTIQSSDTFSGSFSRMYRPLSERSVKCLLSPSVSCQELEMQQASSLQVLVVRQHQHRLWERLLRYISKIPLSN